MCLTSTYINTLYTYKPYIYIYIVCVCNLLTPAYYIHYIHIIHKYMYVHGYFSYSYNHTPRVSLCMIGIIRMYV